MAVALELGIDAGAIGTRLADLPAVDHRLRGGPARRRASLILDDTYNANPAGAAGALAALAAVFAGRTGTTRTPARHRRPRRTDVAVVTPGMVELGPRQAEENRRFGAAIAAMADDLVVVGRTNRRALLAGVASVPGPTVEVTVVDDRDAGRGLGATSISAPGTPCCTRTICRTTTLEQLSRLATDTAAQSAPPPIGGVRPPCPTSPSSSEVPRPSTT